MHLTVKLFCVSPQAARPWLLLDLRLPPRHVEVNVHPTKREVGFMHQVGGASNVSNAWFSKCTAP